MSLYWSTVIIDLFSQPGVERLQDLGRVAGVDMGPDGSKPHPTTSPKPSPSTLVLSFPKDTPNLTIRELMEVWAGWRDDATGVWSPVDPAGDPALPFGGYITKLRERLDGNEKQFECELSDYGILLTKTRVLGWPVFPINAVPTAYRGYPGGYSVEAWLKGRTSEGFPFDGVLVRHWNDNVRYTIDPALGQIAMTADVMPGWIDPLPGLGLLQGYFGFAGLDAVVQVLADATMYALAKNYQGGGGAIVGYWVGTTIAGTRLVPDFHWQNVADLTRTPDIQIAADFPLQPGEIGISDFWHERDATHVVTRVTMAGVGGEAPGLGSNPGDLVYADIYDDTPGGHGAQYPTAYQRDPGWAGPPISETRLHSVELAQFLATYVENRCWGALGNYSGTIDQAAIPGWWARLRIPNEQLNRVIPITEAVSGANDGSYDIHLGFTQLTPADVLQGGLSDVLLYRQDAAYQQWANKPSRAAPGTPKQVPVELSPTHPTRNSITAGFKDTSALILHATDKLRAGQHGATAAAPTFGVHPPATAEGQIPAMGTYISGADARPHPQSYALGFSANATTEPYLLPYDTAFSVIVTKGTGSVVLNKNGGAVAGPFSGDGEHTFGPVLYEYALLDDWSLTVSGVGTALSVTVRE